MNQRSLRLLVAWLCLGLGPAFVTAQESGPKTIQFHDGQRIALVGNSTAERMNLFGHFETLLHLRTPDKRIVVRNFGWPADEVNLQQRPSNYTEIDDPMSVFGPDLFICCFGFNESFAGAAPQTTDNFITDYRRYLTGLKERFTVDGRVPEFILVTPMAAEETGHDLQPRAKELNASLAKYAAAVRELGEADGHRVVDVFAPTQAIFAADTGANYTINGIHLNERGDQALAQLIDLQLFGGPLKDTDDALYERVRAIVNEKSWLHLQDYRMLNGWYVYGGRRTWDTKTFPTEFRKIRNMVAVRDRYLWDLVAGKEVPPTPDDSETGSVYLPETMFGSRDEKFRELREPETLDYPSPEESIAQMSVPDGFEVQLFASEQEFPQLANPSQIAFDAKGRLWAACMVNYPQWLPGAAKPSDRLLIFTDTDGDGKADECTTFYDQLICPTGFEFYKGGVLVVDEPRILWLKDTDGDDVADQVVHLLDGIATDDTHHAMGAWEYSHGGLLHMLEGISMSTTLETPWGPFRNHGPSGAYVWDLQTLRIRHFRTPSYGNPWCLVFDRWGNGIIGDGTNAQQHWASLLSGGAVQSRRSVEPIFNNEGMRPAVGSDFLTSRHFPEHVHNDFIYACVINMHGIPRFTIEDEPGTAGFTGKRIDDLLSSTDMFFRPVDPKIGPDGALWFGDWCNALIGHMQYSQRDPNRDHEHGRIYRLVYKDKPLLEPETQADKSVDELLTQLTAFEPRTRYRARRELHDRDPDVVLAKSAEWLRHHSGQDDAVDPRLLCEVLWLQEFFHRVDADLLSRILSCEDFHARAAAIHVVGNQWQSLEEPNAWLRMGMLDDHPRVRLETLRAASFQDNREALEIALAVGAQPRDPWIDYVLEHTLQALEPVWKDAADDSEFLASISPTSKRILTDYQHATGPAAAIFKPLRTLMNPDRTDAHPAALRKLLAASGGDPDNGLKVFERACGACHRHGNLGKEFGPDLTEIATRSSEEKIMRSILWPNEEISKGYETVMVVTIDGEVITGFVLAEDDQSISLGIADGKQRQIPLDDIDVRQQIKASSMPEGLLETVAPSEFLDLIAFLTAGWIQTDANADLPLRKHGEHTEISRDAKLRLGDGFPLQWNEQASRFLSGQPPQQYDFAFHSPNQPTQENSVVIQFSAPMEIRHVELENRSEKQFHDRAEGLAIWVSDDGEAWTKAWESDQPQAKWSFNLPAGTSGKYVKLGLTKPGILHLNQGVFFGRPL